MTTEVSEIAAIVSEQICTIHPSFARVARVLPDGVTFELTFADKTFTPTKPVGLDIDSFWPKDCPFSSERKISLFWQFVRSNGCHVFTAILANVLKDLCDNGICLEHEGMPVVDILVLNTLQLDVSDIIAAEEKEVLQVHDPISDTTIPIITTFETMDMLHKLGPEVCYRLGMQQPVKEAKMQDTSNRMKKLQPEAYNGTVPHWWVAAVVEGPGIGHTSKTYELVHLDVCGAAYDPSSLVRAPGSSNLVSLKVFTTPEYTMVPIHETGMEHKLEMKSVLSERASGGKEIITLQPKSVRHFRCYQNETSSIEVTPLATYTELNPLDGEVDAKVRDLVQSLQQNHIKALAVGSKVIVCNIQSKPELNGRSGVVMKATKTDSVSSDRIPVLIKGRSKPISLKLSCIQLPSQKPQYRSLKELRNMVTSEDDATPPPLDERQKDQLRKKLDSGDPAINKVLLSMQSMQTGFTRYADPEFKRGIKEFLKPPLNSLLPPETIHTFRQTYELSNHPKAGDAIKIINIRKASKQRMMSEHPEYVLPNGAVAVPPGSEMARLHTSICAKIQSDSELEYVFQRLEELGLYANPSK